MKYLCILIGMAISIGTACYGIDMNKSLAKSPLETVAIVTLGLCIFAFISSAIGYKPTAALFLSFGITGALIVWMPDMWKAYKTDGFAMKHAARILLFLTFSIGLYVKVLRKEKHPSRRSLL